MSTMSLLRNPTMARRCTRSQTTQAGNAQGRSGNVAIDLLTLDTQRGDGRKRIGQSEAFDDKGAGGTGGRAAAAAEALIADAKYARADVDALDRAGAAAGTATRFVESQGDAGRRQQTHPAIGFDRLPVMPR